MKLFTHSQKPGSFFGLRTGIRSYFIVICFSILRDYHGKKASTENRYSVTGKKKQESNRTIQDLLCVSSANGQGSDEE
jgi:hypothetical protein